MAKFSIMSCFSDAYYCPWAVGQQCHFAFESCLHRPCCRETHVIHKCWGLCCESSWSWSERHRAYQKGRSRVRIALRYYFLSSSLPHLTTKINNWSLVYFLTIINLKILEKVETRFIMHISTTKHEHRVSCLMLKQYSCHIGRKICHKN